MIKQKKDAGICRNKKERATPEKITIQPEEINQKEGRLKRYRQRIKQRRENRTLPNNEIKFYHQLGEYTKTYQQLDTKETEQFLAKIWQPKKHNENIECIKNMTRELEVIDVGLKAETHTDLLKTTLKDVKLENARTWWNTWILVQEIHFHSRQTSTRNEQIPRRSTRTGMVKQRKDHVDPKGPKQKNHPKQLLTQISPTDDVENIYSTNKWRYLLLSNKSQIFPWGTETTPQRIQRHSRVTLYRSAQLKREQNQKERN